jgi:hypothetical protein
VIQMSLSMEEPASPRIEDLLRRLETCPIHLGTTLDGGDCEVRHPLPTTSRKRAGRAIARAAVQRLSQALPCPEPAPALAASREERTMYRTGSKIELGINSAREGQPVRVFLPGVVASIPFETSRQTRSGGTIPQVRQTIVTLRTRGVDNHPYLAASDEIPAFLRVRNSNVEGIDYVKGDNDEAIALSVPYLLAKANADLQDFLEARAVQAQAAAQREAILA